MPPSAGVKMTRLEASYPAWYPAQSGSRRSLSSEHSESKGHEKRPSTPFSDPANPPSGSETDRQSWPAGREGTSFRTMSCRASGRTNTSLAHGLASASE